MEPMDVRRALVVEDHPLYADALTLVMQQALPGVALDGVATLGAAEDWVAANGPPDLVVLDLTLPDAQACDGYMRLSRVVPGERILINSARVDRDCLDRIMAAGAAGFVAKTAGASALRDALTALAEGRKTRPVIGLEGRRTRRCDTAPIEAATDLLDRLSPQQRRILSLIRTGKQNKQIAFEMSLAEATVKAHVTMLLRRLGVRNRTQAALLAESAMTTDDDRVAEKPAAAQWGT